MKITVKGKSPTPAVQARGLPLGTVYRDSESDILLRVDGGALLLSSANVQGLLPSGYVHQGWALDLQVQETYEIEEIILRPATR
jgi:hypothetical protein